MNIFKQNGKGHSPWMHGGAQPSQQSSPSGAPSSENMVSYEVALKSKRQVAEGTEAFVFKKPTDFQFQAGKHVRMTLINPPETDAEGNSRFLSFACTPQDEDLTFVMRMRDTAFKRVLGNLQPGSKVLIQMRIDSPHGSFVLHDDTSKPAVFLIGGIGIVPIYSMIKDALERNSPQIMYLFYSNRRPEDAPFLQELQSMAEQHPSFKLIATMTEPEKSTVGWQDITGFIDQAMIEKYIDNLETPIYYIAGLSEMVKAMKALLVEVGVSEDSIRAEEYDGFTMEHGQTT